MATRSYTVQIDINAQGARVITRDLADIQQQASKTSSALSFFKRGLAALGLGIGIRQLAEYADQVTNLRNRLSLLTDSTVETGRITKELFTIAKDTRSEFDVTAHVFTRMALAARTLGETNDDLLAVTKALNQAVILSGTNAREAANGLLQLSQAIASNRLGGDELRSVLEQLPLVTDLIGRELVRLGLAVNGTRGEVRQLGFEGKITAKIIIDALKAARAELEERFKHTVATIGQALTFLTTSLVELVADFNDMSNSSHLAANAIIFLAKHLKDLADFLVLVAGAFAGVKIFAWVTAFTEAATAAAALAGGLGTLSGAFAAASAGIGTAFAVLGGWPALIGAIIAGLVLLGDKWLNIFGGQNKGNQDALKEASDAMKDITKFPPEIQREIQELNREISETAKILDAQSASWVRNDAVTKKAQDRQAKANARIIELQKTGTAVNTPTLEAQKQAAALEKVLRQLGHEYEALQLNKRARERLVELSRIEEQLRSKGFKGGQLTAALALVEVLVKRNQREKEYREIVDGLRSPQEKLNEVRRAYHRILQDEPRFAEQAKRGLISARIAALEPMTDAFSGLKKATLEQKLEFGNLAGEVARQFRAITDPALQYARTQDAINALVKEYPKLQAQANVRLIEAKIALLDTQRTASAGIERGLLKIGLQVSDTATLVENALTNAFNNAENALVDFFTTGKFEMTDFVNSLQKDLARLALNGLLTKTLGSALGLNGGNGASGIAGFLTNVFGGNKSPGIDPNTGGPAGAGPLGPGFARGGSFLVGGSGGVDSQAVAFRATPGERVMVQTPGQQRAGSRPSNVTIIVNTPDAESFQRSQGQILARTQRQLERASRREN